jgi:hemerythrin-like domain-containing protein
MASPLQTPVNMNAIDLLRDEHRRIEELFDRIEQADTPEDKRSLFEQARSQLESHMRGEESVLYPMLAERPGYGELIEDSFDEHTEAKELIRETAVAPPESFSDSLDELIEAVLHHVDEEESELFPRLLETLGEEQLEAVGARLDEARRGLSQAA